MASHLDVMQRVAARFNTSPPAAVPSGGAAPEPPGRRVSTTLSSQLEPEVRLGKPSPCFEKLY